MAVKVVFYQGALDHSGAVKSTLKIASGVSKVLMGEVLLVTGMVADQHDFDTNIPVINFNKRVRFQLFDLISYIRKERPDVIISSIPSSSLMAYLGVLFSRSKSRLIVVERTSPTIEVQLHKSWINRFYTVLRKFVYRRVDAVVAVSNGVKGELIELVGLEEHLIDVIYNPAITGEKLSSGRSEVSHKWIAQDIPLIVGLGRLVAQKDFATLIRAFGKIQSKIDSRLIIIGEGEERETLEKLIQELHLADKVELAGFKPNPYPYLRKADLFVLSSAWEGLPNALLEAMAFGTSVVSTNCKSGPDEILENGTIAPLVPVGDVDAMAVSMISVLNNPQDSKILMDRANMFNEEQSILQYKELIEKLLSE